MNLMRCVMTISKYFMHEQNKGRSRWAQNLFGRESELMIQRFFENYFGKLMTDLEFSELREFADFLRLWDPFIHVVVDREKMLENQEIVFWQDLAT